MTDLTKLSDAELQALYEKAKAKPPEPKEPSASDQLLSGIGHGTGVAARAVVNGITGYPAMLANATTVPLLNAAISPFTDKRFGNQQQAVNQAMTTAGVAEPANGAERIGSDALSAATGAGGVSKLAELGNAVSPLIRGIAAKLAQGTGTQVASAAAGGAAGGTAREAGLPPWGQLLASVLGSASIPAGQAVGTYAHNLAEPYIGDLDAIKGRLLNALLGDRRTAVMDKLTEPAMPGSLSTAAEKAVGAGSTELSALQKLLASKYDPSGYRDIANRQQYSGSGDLLRQGFNDEMAHAGAARTASVLGQTLSAGEKDVPPMLDREVMITRAILNRLTGKATEKTLVPLTQEMKDPAKLLELLRNAPPEEKPALLEQFQRILAGNLQTAPQQTQGGQ